MRGGAFVGGDGRALAAPPGLPNAHMRLYGGAQYHRAMAEFRAAVGGVPCPDIAREEIVNACGVDDFHDGVNYTRTACVIAVSKARDALEPVIHQLGFRFAHVLRRMLPIAMHLLAKEDGGADPAGHDLFLQRVGAAYHAFIDAAEKGCRARCLEDLLSTTRYVTWSLHTGGGSGGKKGGGLRGVLGRPVGGGGPGGAAGTSGHHNNASSSTALARRGDDAASLAGGTVADLLESTLWNRQLGAVSEEIVAALVCQIFEGIRDHVVQAVELKFNCFFLMPLLDAFPARLREELEAAYEDLDTVFDVGAVRAALEGRLRSLESELAQVERLQRKFASIHSTLAQQAALQPKAAAAQGGGGGGAENAEAAADAARAARLAEKMRGVSVSASGEVRTSRAALASLR
jgi:hypothetical protein